MAGLVLIDYLPYQLRNGLTDEQWEYWKALNTPAESALAEYPDLERLDHQRILEQELASASLKPLPLIVLSKDEPFDLTPFVEDGRLPDEMYAEEFADFLFQAVLAARANFIRQVPGTLQTRTAVITSIRSILIL